MVTHEERPIDETQVHTTDLPELPQRDRRIPARAWVEAPAGLRALGDDLDPRAEATYIRRIHGWLLWRAGPPSKGEARYMAIAADDLARHHVLRVLHDGSGAGVGPSGEAHERFRTWKEDLRDHPRA